MSFNSKFSRLFRQWLLLFVPYHSLNHFRSYLDVATELTINPNGKFYRQATCLHLTFIIYFFLNLYLWMSHPLSIGFLRYSDVVTLTFETPTFYPCLCAIILQTMYFYHYLFLKAKAPFLRMFEQILFTDSTPMLQGIEYDKYTTQQTARFILLFTCNLLKFFIIGLGKLAFFLLFLDHF